MLLGFCRHFPRGECTDTLRRRITELEAECKKLTMDIKLKEEQIRELELKVQVRSSSSSSSNSSSWCLLITLDNDPAVPYTFEEVLRTCDIYFVLFLSVCLPSLSDRSFINIRKMKKTQRC